MYRMLVTSKKRTQTLLLRRLCTFYIKQLFFCSILILTIFDNCNSKFSGIKVECYQNSAIYKVTQYIHGVKEGVEIVYSLNGVIKDFAFYHHGKKDGPEQGWYAEGSKRFEFHFKNGLLHGTQTEWHLNGSIFRQVVYENGVEVAKKIFYPHGEIFTNYVKNNGRIYGEDGGSLCFDNKREGEK